MRCEMFGVQRCTRAGAAMRGAACRGCRRQRGAMRGARSPEQYLGSASVEVAARARERGMVPVVPVKAEAKCFHATLLMLLSKRQSNVARVTLLLQPYHRVVISPGKMYCRYSILVYCIWDDRLVRRFRMCPTHSRCVRPTVLGCTGTQHSFDSHVAHDLLLSCALDCPLAILTLRV